MLACAETLVVVAALVTPAGRIPKRPLVHGGCRGARSKGAPRGSDEAQLMTSPEPDTCNLAAFRYVAAERSVVRI